MLPFWINYINLCRNKKELQEILGIFSKEKWKSDILQEKTKQTKKIPPTIQIYIKKVILYYYNLL